MHWVGASVIFRTIYPLAMSDCRNIHRRLELHTERTGPECSQRQSHFCLKRQQERRHHLVQIMIIASIYIQALCVNGSHAGSAILALMAALSTSSNVITGSRRLLAKADISATFTAKSLDSTLCGAKTQFALGCKFSTSRLRLSRLTELMT